MRESGIQVHRGTPSADPVGWGFESLRARFPSRNQAKFGPLVRVDHQRRLAEIGPARAVQFDERVHWRPGEPMRVAAIPPFDEVDEDLAGGPGKLLAALLVRG